MNVEQEIWGHEAPQGGPALVVESVRDRLSAMPPGAPQSRCATHGVTGCLACLVAQRDTAKASVPAPEVPPATPPVVQPAPLMAPTPATEPVPKIVALAEAYAAAVRKLETEEKLLIAAQTRVEMLAASIAESKAAVEKARKNLATLVASGDSNEQ